jgi:uncharacterized protein
MHKLAFTLLIIGGLNWGLTALVGGWDLANWLGSTVTMIVYILVGLAALYEVFTHKGVCRACGN